MNIPFRLVTALLGAAIANGHAFTLDAVGYAGGNLAQNPFSVFVPGYGELVFEAAPGSELVVDSAYRSDKDSGGPSLHFDKNEAVKITFSSLEPLDVNDDFTGKSADESFVMETDLFTSQTFVVPREEQADGSGGRHAITWNAVPEPAASVLGAMGALLLVLHRRR